MVPRPPAHLRLLLFGVGFALLGLYFSVGVFLSYRKERWAVDHTVQATGMVVDYVKITRRSTRRTHDVKYYRSVFTFTDRGGTVHRVTSKEEDKDEPDHQIGQTVPVRYDPDHPDDARLDGMLGAWPATSLGVVLSLGCFSLGARFLARSRRSWNASRPPDPGGGIPRDPAILSGP